VIATAHLLVTEDQFERAAWPASCGPTTSAPTRWSHVNDHLTAGMITRYQVKG
jgi:hypothetical protein